MPAMQEILHFITQHDEELLRNQYEY